MSTLKTIVYSYEVTSVPWIGGGDFKMPVRELMDLAMMIREMPHFR
jgi:hypothetical protein